MTWLAQLEAKRLVLSLREMLVRFDENIAANTLLQECVPYILEDDPDVARARAEQALKVAHITGESSEYSEYYASNQHERPFEEQYQQQPSEAHLHLHRVAFLREWLAEQVAPGDEEDALRGDPVRLLDVACNDGWMAQNLTTDFKGETFPAIRYHGLDLNPGCIERAKARGVQRAKFKVGRAEDAYGTIFPGDQTGPYDAVVAFELVEHVKDPDAVLAAMASVCKPGGSLFVSTPLGACTGGDLPHWWVVEPAGHVRAFTPRTFAELLNRHAHCDYINIHQASQGELMVARAIVRDPEAPRHVLSEKGFGAWDTVEAPGAIEDPDAR